MESIPIKSITLVALLAVFVSLYLWPIIQSSGLLDPPTVPFGLAQCQKAIEPKALRNCEDIVPFPGAGNEVILSCDPARDYVNRVMGQNYTKPGESLPEGEIWRVNYATKPIQVTQVKRNGPEDFHPVGITVDQDHDTQRLLAVNLAHYATPSIEVYVLKDNTLVHTKTIRHPKLYNPNSLHVLEDPRFRAADGTPSFFASNDHYFDLVALKMVETMLSLPLTSVVFYDARTQDVYPVGNKHAFSNGLAGTDEVLFVAETSRGAVHKYTITIDDDQIVRLDKTEQATMVGSPDNLQYDPKTEQLFIAVHPKPLTFVKFATAREKSVVPKPPSAIMVWDTKAEHDPIKTILSDDGTTYGSASAVVADSVNNKLLVSGLYEDGLLICPFNK